MIMKVADKGKIKKGYRVHGVVVVSTKDGLVLNFNATSIPQGKQAELLKEYRNLVINQLELLNINLEQLEK